jgi:hypothetical protein
MVVLLVVVGASVGTLKTINHPNHDGDGNGNGNGNNWTPPYPNSVTKDGVTVYWQYTLGEPCDPPEPAILEQYPIRIDAAVKNSKNKSVDKITLKLTVEKKGALWENRQKWYMRKRIGRRLFLLPSRLTHIRTFKAVTGL